MGESKLQIPKVCPQCGNTFLAKTIKTVYCSNECCWIARNEQRKRDRREKVLKEIKGCGKEYITITEALKIFTTSRNTIRRLIQSNKVHYSRISPKKIFVSIQDLETLFPLRPANTMKDNPKQNHIFDMSPEKCYTIGEVSVKFSISEKSVYKHIREFSIPMRQIGRYVYVPKVEINKIYNNKNAKK